MKIWMNGAFVSASGAIDATDRGLTLGDGVFETLAVLGGRPSLFKAHMGRLRNGAAVLGITVPAGDEEILAALETLAESADVDEGSARITLTRGPAQRGVLPPANARPTLMATVHAGDVGWGTPLSAIVAKGTRRNERSQLSAIKSTNYADAILARMEAEAAGAGDAILLNTADRVAEATAANVFCVIAGGLVTPPLSDGALAGIMRAEVLSRETVEERSLSKRELAGADEIILTSSLSIRPVTRVDGRPVGAGRPGPFAKRLAGLPRRV